MNTLLTSSDPEERRIAAEELAAVNSPAVLTTLSAALEDENKGVRDAASRSLLALGTANAARSIAHQIGNTNIATRNLAARLLVKLGSFSIPAVLPFLQEGDKDIRKFAVDILGEINSPDSAYYLLPLLADPDPNVSISVIEALGNVRSAQALSPVCRAYEEHPAMRTVAAEAIGKIGGDDAREFLETQLRFESAQAKSDGVLLFALIEALGQVGTMATMQQLMTMVSSLPETLRNMLTHAAVQIVERNDAGYDWPAGMRSAFLLTLKSDDQNFRLSAAKGLWQFRDPGVTSSLIRALGDSDDIDFAVYAQLADRDDVFLHSVEALEEGLSRGSAQVIQLVGKLAGQAVRSYRERNSYPMDHALLYRAFAAAAARWYEAEQEEREMIIDTLFQLDGDQAAEFLLPVLSELDPWLRIHAIDQLKLISNRRAQECIFRLMEDDQEMVREAAQDALQSLGYTFDESQFGLSR